MTTMVFCFTGGAVLAALIILIVGANIKFDILAEYSAVRINISILLRKKVRILRVRYLFLWQDMAVYRNGKRLITQNRKKTPHGKLAPTHAINYAKRCVDIMDVTIRGGIGIRDDAFSSVILSGIANHVILEVAKYLGAGAGKSCIVPAFDRSVFSLQMEGILRFYPAQIMYAVLKLPRKRRQD